MENLEDALAQLELKSSVQERQEFLISLKSTKPRIFRQIDRKVNHYSNSIIITFSELEFTVY